MSVSINRILSCAMHMLLTLKVPVIVSVLCGGSIGFWPFHNFASAEILSDSQHVRQVAIIGM
jgi:hypothetical protein